MVMDRCEICGAKGSFRRIELREMQFGTRQAFTYLHCPACGVLRITAAPDDLARHDRPDDDGLESGPPARPGPLARMADRAMTELALFGRAKSRARLLRRWTSAAPITADQRARVKRLGLSSFADPILDVGCGSRAANLIALRRLGFRSLLGVDSFLESDHQVEGVRLRRAAIHDVAGSFQAITFHHSFERVPDPLETLKTAARLLRPGGVVLIRTPVFGTWFWDRFGSSWSDLDPPRHLFVHTRASIERLATDSGLELIEVIWDSSFVEMIASTQIARDIAWREPASWLVNPPAGFSDAMIQDFTKQVLALNVAGDAGRAGFYLRRMTGPDQERPA
jgi:SAM-dependent methyltransferase